MPGVSVPTPIVGATPVPSPVPSPTPVAITPVYPAPRYLTIPPVALTGVAGYDTGPAGLVIDCRDVADLVLTGIVGGSGALTGMRTEFEAVTGGTPVPAMIDGDHALVSNTLPESIGLTGKGGNPTPTNVPAGSAFQLTYPLARRHREIRFQPAGPATVTVSYELSRND